MNSSTLTTSEEAFCEDMKESIDFLYHRVTKLDTKDQGFCRSMIKYYGTYSTLTPKQLPYAVKFWLYLKNQEDAGFCTQIIANIDWEFKPILELFNQAKQHLKFPKIVFFLNNIHYCMYVGIHMNPGFINIKKQDTGSVVLSVNPNTQEFHWRSDTNNEEKLRLKHFLDSEDIIAKLSAHGRAYNHCCFCGFELTNAESVTRGYGPICAGHWRLPWDYSTLIPVILPEHL